MDGKKTKEVRVHWIDALDRLSDCMHEWMDLMDFMDAFDAKHHKAQQNVREGGGRGAVAERRAAP